MQSHRDLLQHDNVLRSYKIKASSLKELLRAKLIECGWKDQLKAHCKEVIKEKGLEHVTVDDLVAEITPKGRGKEYKLCERKGVLKTWFLSLSCWFSFSFFL
uniref:ENY2 transcription and export complex 2 subunit n=1 Tax=Ursus americanus TaxID=9643 RepID=A0A452QD15_URSAM